MEFATFGGWRSCSRKILPKSSILLRLDFDKESVFNKGELRGLSAPKVPS
jgi:hypothetical protein